MSHLDVTWEGSPKIVIWYHLSALSSSCKFQEQHPCYEIYAKDKKKSEKEYFYIKE